MIPHRCKKCHTRRSLKKRITWYIRPPKCKECGGQLRVDEYRLKNPEKDRGGKTCKSDCMSAIYGFDFPHRVGTPGCRQNNAEKWPEEEKKLKRIAPHLFECST